MPHPRGVGLAGTVDDFEGFFGRYARELAAAVALATGDIDAAEDAVQEAMAKAHDDWGRVARMDRPDLWVLRVAHRKAIDSWRKRSRNVVLDDASAPAKVPDVIQRLWLRWGLEHLTPEDRTLVILRHRDGLTIDEVALALGKSSTTVGIYLKRARRRLRDVLKETNQ